MCFQQQLVKANMFRTAIILIAGVVWTFASGMYTESIEERMANLEKAVALVKENDKTLLDLLAAVGWIRSFFSPKRSDCYVI